MGRHPLDLPLYPGEHVIHGYTASFAAPASLYLLTAAALAGFYFVFPHVLALIAIVLVFLTAAAHAAIRAQYVWILTNERLIARSGIFTRTSTTIRHDRVTDTSSRRPLLAALFGTGEVYVSTAGAEGHMTTIFAQHDPARLEQLLNNLKRNHRYAPHEGER